MSITFGWDIEAAFSDLIFGFKRSFELVSIFWEIESFSIFKDSLQRSVLHFVSLLRLECFGAVEMLLELPSSTFFIPEPGRCRPKKGVNVFDFNTFFVVIASCYFVVQWKHLIWVFGTRKLRRWDLLLSC